MITIKAPRHHVRDFLRLFPRACAFSILSRASVENGVFGNAPRRVMRVVAMDIVHGAS